jgi:hypothetical protein
MAYGTSPLPENFLNSTSAKKIEQTESAYVTAETPRVTYGPADAFKNVPPTVD